MPLITSSTIQDEIVYWTDAQGNQTRLAWLFAQNDPALVWDRKGAYMPTAIYSKATSPLQDGALIQFLRFAERQLELRVELFADDITTLKRRMGELLSIFSPVKGDGVLSFTHENGVTRSLRCHLVSGLEGNEPMEYGVGFVSRMVWVFEAGDPFFYDSADTTQNATITGGNGGGGTTYSQTLTVPTGTARSWPRWAFTVPHQVALSASNTVSGTLIYHIPVTVTNLTTGAYFSYSHDETVNFSFSGGSSGSIATDTIRTIDTRPGIKTVKNGSGAAVQPTYRNLWPLVAGTNSVRVDIAVPATTTTTYGPTTVTAVYSVSGATVNLVFSPAYLGIN